MAVSRRQSTNYKLTAFIHAKNTEEADELALINEEKEAKLRLRRASLYGNGARAKIPKVKKKKKSDWSPFKITGVPGEEEQPKGEKKLVSSIPPGAHTDQFRVVTNPTMRSYNDPDRVCINSSSQMEGLHVINQPPWYVGNNNKVVPPDANMLTAAHRYGYRGSRNIQQYNTKYHELPSKTRNEHTPAFLNGGDFVDEWVPPIVAATYQTINSSESPKLWPENTVFVNGYKKKELPTSSRYLRETTTGEINRPKTSETLNLLMNTTHNADEMLRSSAKQESLRKLSSLPIEAQKAFTQEWGTKVNQLATGSLKHSLTRAKPEFQAFTLMDPSDFMKYSGSTAMIVHTQSTDELKFRLRMERNKVKSMTPFEMKWLHCSRLFQDIKIHLKRKQTMDGAITEISRKLQQAAIVNGSLTSMSRLTFITCCSKISYMEEVSSKHLGMIFSVFDPMKKDIMRFVEFISTLVLLNNPSHEATQKIDSLWLVINEYGQDRNLFDTALEILSVPCGSMSESEQVEHAFAEEFRITCYHMAITAQDKHEGSAGTDSGGLGGFNNTGGFSNTTGSRGGGGARQDSRASTPGTAPLAIHSSQQGTKANQQEKVETEKLMNKKTLSVQPQYNICEHYLNAKTFPIVLANCPSILPAFDDMLSDRLTTCYGIDERRKQAEEEEVEEERDFSWILKSNNTAPKNNLRDNHDW